MQSIISFFVSLIYICVQAAGQISLQVLPGSSLATLGSQPNFFGAFTLPGLLWGGNFIFSGHLYFSRQLFSTLVSEFFA